MRRKDGDCYSSETRKCSMVKFFNPKYSQAPLMSSCTDKGSIQPLFIIILLITCISGMGIWGVFRHWRFLVELQFRLNQCVGSHALALKDSLNSIESQNQKIIEIRAAISSARAIPHLLAPLELAASSAALDQEITLARWGEKQIQWLASRGCDRKRDFAVPLPSLLYQRYPPDELGIQPLHWVGLGTPEFYLQISHSPRHAAAKVSKKNEITKYIPIQSTFPHHWQAQWSPPFSNTRTSFY